MERKKGDQENNKNETYGDLPPEEKGIQRKEAVKRSWTWIG